MFKLEFKTGNAAFENAPEVETARILSDIASHLLNGYKSRIVRDVNGNNIGSWELTEND